VSTYVVGEKMSRSVLLIRPAHQSTASEKAALWSLVSSRELVSKSCAGVWWVSICSASRWSRLAPRPFPPITLPNVYTMT
jgi:hypothetical protein